jgi:NAD(P)-dependent dehydrogenase (short-subunit alcohol dehydrogenase family)
VVTALGDVAEARQCEAMVKRGFDEFGAIDALVCNATNRQRAIHW